MISLDKGLAPNSNRLAMTGYALIWLQFLLLTMLPRNAEAGIAGGVQKAIAWFKENAGDDCRKYQEIEALFSDEPEKAIQTINLTPTDRNGEILDHGEFEPLYQFFCDAGAYNTRYLFIQ